MLKMEKGSNHGGILADDMGLGKTIQSIATIVSNRPPTDRHGPTLIVAPVSLVNQWEQEIRDKTKPDTLKIYSYYGAKRTKDAKLLKEFDIIITSYPLLGNDWPTDKKGKGKAAAPKIKTRGEESDEEVLDVSKRSAAGPLFKIKFHRVILDEAHFIKNKNTRAALAACQLETTHRWCLTGTPIQNSLDELYSLIKFLQIKPYCEWTNFQTKISKPFKKGRHQQVLQRVQYVLKAICLRRTKTSLLDGKAIITLPKREVIIDAVQMSQAEREFYDALEKRQKLRFNAYLRAGTVQKNYTNILTLLLRLRQACLHPSLLKDQDKAPEPEDDESIQRLQRQLESLKVDVKTRLLNSGSEEGDCPICFDAPQAAVFVPNCGHVYCNECIVSYINNESAAVKVCPTCRGPIAENALISLASFMKKYRPEEEAAADAKGKAPATEEELLQDLVTADTPATWLSSTKIERTMVLLEQTRLKHPGEKTIIFSNFTGMLDLLEVPLQQAGFKYTRYDGSMDLKARTAATEQLHNDPETCVMLTSIKCGSLGLNLTCANRVIMLDFWWNPAVENQAIDRVHRFGQTKDVVVHRITVQRTVEDRILEMQAKKQDMADQALGEGDGDGRSLAKGRLGLNDLIHLFGADL
ncbi:SNF2 family N-terminal domain-containing protein [Entophlyctis helioformis]|nr:SNF2 family N-terminal domain-containing protein [Entophlyctis helioformis]